MKESLLFFLFDFQTKSGYGVSNAIIMVGE